jgi:diaminopimelate decarboxylase/aspartate kinase
MPPARSPSPLTSSKIVYSSAAGSSEEGADGGQGADGFALDGGSAHPTVLVGEGGAAARSRTPSPNSLSRSGSSPSNDGRSSPKAAAPSKGLVASSGPAKVLAVARRKGVTLVSMVAYDMWGNAGFLSKVFTPFGAHGVSVDLIATSQYAVSVTLDHIPDGIYGEPFRRVVASLSKVCTVEVRYPCAVVSVVGRSLRNALPALGRAMRALEGVPVHMVSEASEDLNMSFVVDEEHADDLVASLHAELLESDAIDTDPQFGPVWTAMPCGKA